MDKVYFVMPHLKGSIDFYQPKPKFPKWLILLIIGLVLSIVVMVNKARAEEINVEKLADAIYLAEGGAKTRYPYGILTKYKVTTPRQACINTINHALKDWNGKGDFISFLGSRYAPTKNCANDPTGLNKNWIRLVKYFLNKER